MARKVFFSFKYDDVARAMIVRNSWVTQDSAGFIDKADFEEVKRKGDAAIKKWIDENLKYKSCLVVLIGTETANRKWIDWEIYAFKKTQTWYNNFTYKGRQSL